MSLQSNYMKKILEERQLKPGEVVHAIILHDDLCGFWDKNLCNCNPDVKYVTDEEYRKSLTGQKEVI